MNLTIALPVTDGHLHEHFGGCREFALVTVDQQSKAIVATQNLSPPEHRPGAFPRWLREQAVDVVIASGIGERALANFAQQGIDVRLGTAGVAIIDLVRAYLQNLLTQKPPSCGHHGHHHHHHHHPHHSNQPDS